MSKLHPWCIVGLLLGSWLAPMPSLSYEPEVHQQLTFIAARQFNECVKLRPGVPRLSALDTRYIVKSNVSQADTNPFVRMFRWNYYNRKDQSARTSLGLIDTRFHSHFEELVDATKRSDNRDKRLQNLGRIVNYMQDVTSPAHVVPVYTGRWWRFSLSDKFDHYRVDTRRLQASLIDSCDYVFAPVVSFQDVLQAVATRTIMSVQESIFGFPVSWQAYWRLASDPGEFGEYGRAGNSFGERTEFRCGNDERCLLLEDDPLYRDFAAGRHLSAVLATMSTVSLLQMDEAERAQAMGE